MLICGAHDDLHEAIIEELHIGTKSRKRSKTMLTFHDIPSLYAAVVKYLEGVIDVFRLITRPSRQRSNIQYRNVLSSYVVRPKDSSCCSSPLPPRPHMESSLHSIAERPSHILFHTVRILEMGIASRGRRSLLLELFNIVPLYYVQSSSASLSLRSVAE